MSYYINSLEVGAVPLDIDRVADRVESAYEIDFRDPFSEEYGNPDRQTRTQRKAWRLLNDGLYRIAIIGAKGAGKTFFGAAWAFFMGQKYPNTHGVICAGTKDQAKDAAGQAFSEVGSLLGFEYEYFRSKKLGSDEYSKFYVVDLDGTGYERGLSFKLFVRSMEAVDAMEGSEYDWGWFEELQDISKDNFVKASSRVRGTGVVEGDGRKPMCLCGMTQGEEHWMYDTMEESMGLVPEADFQEDKHTGILFEPSLNENEHNIGAGTIEQYRSNFSPDKAARLINAERVSSNTNRAIHQYRTRVHRKGRLSKTWAGYVREKRGLIVGLDFNVAPMCASVWQERPFNQQWRSDRLLPIYSESGRLEEVRVFASSEAKMADTSNFEVYDSYSDWREADGRLLAQVDEFEVWPDDPKGGGTVGMMEKITQKYANHHGEVLIVGDASGTTRDAAAMRRSNWDIVEEYAAERLRNPSVMRGLEWSSDISKGKTKYYNPPVEDTLNVANAVHKNARGEVRICYLMDSRYESGGAASSVAATKTKPDGSIDKKPDRSEKREKPKTHYVDTVRYVLWEWTNRGELVSASPVSLDEDMGGSEGGGSQDPMDYLYGSADDDIFNPSSEKNRWMI